MNNAFFKIFAHSSKNLSTELFTIHCSLFAKKTIFPCGRMPRAFTPESTITHNKYTKHDYSTPRTSGFGR